ncbi:hypothetical protein Sdia_00160 [Streptomyces diastaticus subsp. diastaticus]|uniref:Uncharacterized protein n=1 Tax=Streptomyces diastaticus subsp. diastaticus TaxID=68040 RepID=A0ABQ1CFX0_STRDI|nr:hypothetical protein Sdia_00160 [Streptomyces diastaticus subsp. diastaticus]GGU33380.1 hypothetical protein GCM10015534_39890 [Streptomyces diastaticus subsp. diastaticus]
MVTSAPVVPWERAGQAGAALAHGAWATTATRVAQTAAKATRTRSTGGLASGVGVFNAGSRYGWGTWG